MKTTTVLFKGSPAGGSGNPHVVKPKWLTDGKKDGQGESGAGGSETIPEDAMVPVDGQGKKKKNDDRILRLLRQTNNEVFTYSALIARKSYEDMTKDGL